MTALGRRNSRGKASCLWPGALRRIFPRRVRPGIPAAAILLFLSFFLSFQASAFEPPQVSAFEEEEGFSLSHFSLFALQGPTAQVHLPVSDPPWLSEREEGPSEKEEAPRPGLVLRVRDYAFYTFPRHLLEGAQTSFWGKNLVVLAVAGGVTGALLIVDNEIRDFFKEKRPIGRTAREVGNTLGNGATLFGIAGATYGVGEVLDHRGLAESGEVFIEGLSLVGLATGLLKITTQRRRPDGSNTLSFPSGHASESFAFAAMVDGRFGHMAGLPSYLAAGFVSFARLQSDKHFFTDTFFGGVLGTVVGYAVEKIHRAKGDRRWVIAPLAGPEEVGLQVGLRF